MVSTTATHKRGLILLLSIWALGSISTSVAAAPRELADELVVSGKVVYGSAKGATRGAEVDIYAIYANNPAYMRIEQLGLSKTEGHGKELFAAAERAAKKALAAIAKEHDLDVITHLDGVKGGEIDIEDHTEAVIDKLPVFYIDGTVLHGNARATERIAEMDKDSVLRAIPAYIQWLELDEDDANYYILRERFTSQYKRALQAVVRDRRLVAVVELGGTTSRLEPAPDISDEVIAALDT